MSNLATELKPLVATLKEMQFGSYLQCDSFENQMLKNNLDEIWHAAIRVTNPQDTIYIGDTYVHEESFIFCIDKLWGHDRQMFYLFVTTTISGFIRYTEPTEDLSELVECLETLEFSHKSLSTINGAIKRRQDTSITKQESQALKSVKMQ